MTMFTLTLILTVLGTGNPYLLWEKTHDLKPRLVIQTDDGGVNPIKVVSCKVHDNVVAAPDVPTVTVSHHSESLTIREFHSVTAAPTSTTSARASPASV